MSIAIRPDRSGETGTSAAGSWWQSWWPTLSLARQFTLASSALVLLGLLAGGVLIGMLMNDYSLMSASGDIWVRLVRIFALLAFVAGAVISVWNAWVVLRSNRRRLAKIWSVLLALSCLVVLYFGIVFRIVGFSANY